MCGAQEAIFPASSSTSGTATHVPLVFMKRAIWYDGRPVAVWKMSRENSSGTWSSSLLSLPMLHCVTDGYSNVCYFFSCFCWHFPVLAEQAWWGRDWFRRKMTAWCMGVQIRPWLMDVLGNGWWESEFSTFGFGLVSLCKLFLKYFTKKTWPDLKNRLLKLDTH